MRKTKELYKLLNEVNTQLRFIKFMEKNGRVFAQYSYSIEFNYDPEITLSHIAMLLKSVESAYPKFMNL
ncbi:YbjN domain-containing protein [Halalkalibacter wakoensis]|uniref:YbjN domain-containing protein n=1 Tax=Halalkalibacter wakoensis TaxID=127891 RepID=UPI0012E16195